MAQTARAGFEAVDPRLEAIARTLERSNFNIFWRVTLPLAWPSLLAGSALTFARALGDLGVTSGIHRWLFQAVRNVSSC